MSFITKPRCFIGIEITDDESYKIAAIEPEPSKRGWKVVDVKEVRFHESSPLASLNIAKGRDLLIATAFDAKFLLTRPLTMPCTRSKDIEAALEFQAEDLLPYPTSDAIFTFKIKEILEKQAHLIFYAVKKRHLKEHVQLTHNLNTEHIASIPLALASLDQINLNRTKPYCLIHAEGDKGCCAFIENGVLISSHAFDMLKQDFKLTLAALFKVHGKKISSIFMLGEADHTFLTDVAKEFCSDVKPLIPEANLGIADHLFEKFGLAIGIALNATSSSLNFQKKEFSKQNFWQRTKKPLLTTLILSTCFCLSQFGLVKVMTQSKKANIKSALQELFDLKLLNHQKVDNSLETLEKQISDIEKSEGNYKNKFPLISQTPRALDILAWLSTHPSLVDAYGKSLINVISLNYQYERYPMLTRPKDHYLVKVDFAFSTDSSAVARSFHDALVSQNSLVNPKKEVEWRVEKNIYRTSFYLRDKTYYESN